MKRHLPIVLFALAGYVAAPAATQNRVDSQIFLDLRVVQAQVQKLQLSVNQLAEQFKKIEGRVDASAGDMRQALADQKLLIDALSNQVRTLTERENEVAARSLQAVQEIKVLRESVEAQQKLLNDILAMLQRPVGGLPADPGQPQTPVTGGSVPPSPTAYHNSAMEFFFAGRYDSAVIALEDALKKYPDAVQAARTHLTLGESLEALGGKNQEALATYQQVIQKYKDPDVQADAHLKMGLLYEKMGQKDQAIKTLRQVVAQFKGTSTADLAASHLKRMGG